MFVHLLAVTFQNNASDDTWQYKQTIESILDLYEEGGEGAWGRRS